MKECLDSNGLDKLAILWTSADRDVALRFVFMYSRGAKSHGWWEAVRLIVWGPSAKLLAEDEELQLYIREMRDNGVEILACKACADMYGVGEKLSSLGVEVIYMGEPLTKMLKSDWKVITV